MKDLHDMCETLSMRLLQRDGNSFDKIMDFACEIRKEGWHEGMGYAAAIAEQNGPADCNCEDKILAAALAAMANTKEVDNENV